MTWSLNFDLNQTFMLTFFSLLQNGEKDSTMGRFNLLIHNVGKPYNVTRAIIDLAEGRQAMAVPRSALVQIMHSLFSQVTKHIPSY